MDVVNLRPEQWENPDLAWSGKISTSKKEPNSEFI